MSEWLEYAGIKARCTADGSLIPTKLSFSISFAEAPNPEKLAPTLNIFFFFFQTFAMKVKTISRSENQRETKFEIYKTRKNPDPLLHPFEKQREYTRALNAAKLARLFAKPFLFQLETRESIYALCRMNFGLISGSFDGMIHLWNLDTKTSISTQQEGNVKDLTFYKNEIYSVGNNHISMFNSQLELQNHWTTETVVNSIDHHYRDSLFCTASDTIQLWDSNRQEASQSMQWGSETILKARFNPAEVNVLGSLGSDRSIVLYDIRTQIPISKVVMNHVQNSLSWNPREPFNFVVGGEDHNCYTFDMRHLSNTLCVHKGHVSAVLDVDFSSTGKEFVTGGYDKTIRIFENRGGNSREILHTKRMQKVFTAKFSADGQYVYSGSDDGSIRAWKAEANAKLGIVTILLTLD